MKYSLKHKEHYSPYKIFQKNFQYNRNKTLKNYRNCQFPTLNKKIVIDISKNLKSVAISNKLFSNYMENYNNLTQDFCFKTPDKVSYPLRKNIRYLSAESIKNLKDKKNNSFNSCKMKILKMPISDKPNYNRIQLFNNNKNNKNNIFNKIKKSNNNRNLLLSFSDEKLQKKSILNSFEIKDDPFTNIDIDNNKNIKQENFEYLKKYANKLNNLNESNNINILNNTFDKSKLSLTNFLSKENIQYELNIYSLCVKFRKLNDNKNKKQRLYFKFKYLPIFYLLDYQTFKAFLSEVIYFDNKSNNFSFIKEKFDEVINKYYNYINNNLNNAKSNINDITFFKNEFHFPLAYKWIIFNKDFVGNENNLNIKDEDNKNENEKKVIIFELKIELPKIKFKFLKYDTKIRSDLKKHLMIQLMKTDFIEWEELILLELFFYKKFRFVINSILANKDKYYKQKIYLLSNNYAKNQIKDIKNNVNKNFEFYLSEINEIFSNYYIFNPYKIALKSTKNNYSQEVNLTLRESKILYKIGKYWGLVNTLLKCITYNNESNNKVYFKFDIFENISPNFIKASGTKNKNIEKGDQIKFKFNKLNIIINECSLKKIIINNNLEKEEKFIKIPKNFLKLILTYKDNNRNKIILNENKINEYCKEIREENILEFKKSNNTLKKTSEKDLEPVLIKENNSNITSNKTNKFNIKEGENKIINVNINKNNKNKINQKIIIEKTSNKSIIKEKQNHEIKIIERNDRNLFLTKKETGKNVENNKKNEYEEEQEKENYCSLTFYQNSNESRNLLYLINNRRDLERNRTRRENYLYNNNIGINKLKNTIIGMRQRRANTFKK